jgi:hypothetical protein
MIRRLMRRADSRMAMVSSPKIAARIGVVTVAADVGVAIIREANKADPDNKGPADLDNEAPAGLTNKILASARSSWIETRSVRRGNPECRARNGIGNGTAKWASNGARRHG